MSEMGHYGNVITDWYSLFLLGKEWWRYSQLAYGSYFRVPSEGVLHSDYLSFVPPATRIAPGVHKRHNICGCNLWESLAHGRMVSRQRLNPHRKNRKIGQLKYVLVLRRPTSISAGLRDTAPDILAIYTRDAAWVMPLELGSHHYGYHDRTGLVLLLRPPGGDPGIGSSKANRWGLTIQTMQSPPRSNTNSDWLWTSLLAARTLTAAAESFPYLKGVFGIIVILLETIETVKKNREDLKELCRNVMEIVTIVREQISLHGDTAAVKFKGLCGDLEE
ncbi:hypothetical protein C8F04DRAFT_1195780 [Mycena alexandri]|uniref:Uncharacterized protein n=1 Tax=Mycena alexandri TaxID=1745969 RepID=A0AAD6S6M7_9AGAR|nr:hypothetical protein C8F04DRAFT_1195780 [Mycena alexandri]